MRMVLWWVGDAVLIAVCFPVIVMLLVRIIRPLAVARRALASISRSAISVTRSMPLAMTEIGVAAQASSELHV